jgi:hypothetical protein
MKRGAALLLCMVLLVSAAVCAYADSQKLLYPGLSIQGESVYCAGVPLDGGTLEVSADGSSIDFSVSTIQDSQLGVTYYCVVSVTSALSNIQREQQHAGLVALSEALRPNDSMVLVTMGREIAFGEKLSDHEAITNAIEQACSYDTYGTNFLEGVDTILSTISEQETGFSSLVFFTDGKDNAGGVVKFTEDQIARIIQSSGRAVSFIALLTPGVTAYDLKNVQKLEEYADVSLGGIYREPYLEDNKNYVNAAENAAREVVNQVSDWTVLQISTNDLPRDEKEAALTVTWTGSGRTISDSVSIPTEDLPPLPEPTQPETEPETAPPTQAPAIPETEPVIIPEYEAEEPDNTLYYIIIGSGVALLLIILTIIIVSARKKAVSRRRDARNAEDGKKEPPAGKPIQAASAPAAGVSEKQPEPEAPVRQEAPRIDIPPLGKREAPDSQHDPENQASNESTPSQQDSHEHEKISPKEGDVLNTSGMSLLKKEEAPVKEEKSAPQDQNVLSLDDALLRLKTKLEESESAPAVNQAASKPAEPVPDEAKSSSVQLSEPLIHMPEDRQKSEAPVLHDYAVSESSAKPDNSGCNAPEQKQQSQACAPGVSGSAQPYGAVPDSMQQEAPAVPAPASAPQPVQRGNVSGCTVRLMPEGNPGGSIYVTMDANSRCTFGRNSKSQVILNAKDTSLSGLHFELQWDGKTLYITDRKSTNGTSLTGIPQRPGRWSRVESGSTIGAGSIRYKVKITK